MDTYHCHWCGRNGQDIDAQAVTVRRVDVFPPEAVRRWACWACGMDVEPGPHRAEKGAGQDG